MTKEHGVSRGSGVLEASHVSDSGDAAPPKDVAASSAETEATAAATGVDLDELVGGDADIAFEQELRRDPYQLKIWLAYLKAREKAKPGIR